MRLRRFPLLVLLVVIVSLGLARPVLSDPEWTIPRFAEPPATFDGRHAVEGTATAPPWSVHGRFDTRYLYGVGLAERASQVRGQLGAGLGLPGKLELGVSLPVGWTFGAEKTSDDNFNGPEYRGMDRQGAAVGDIQAALLFSVYDALDGGLGLLFGVKGSAPTGDHARLMGEGGFTAEPFGSVAIQVLGARLSLNLGYRFRPQHTAPERHDRFEQDDDFLWRLGFRIPRKHDVAWSLEAEGAVGVLTRAGPWPAAPSRPVFLLGGVDFPVSRMARLSLLVGAGIVGQAAPTVTIGMGLSWMSALPDEDDDGIAGGADECPLLPEDRDGFQDADGCPDLDNDRDGFPDDEDQCPLKKAGNFSEDGC